jgi:hypothetical protein
MVPRAATGSEDWESVIPDEKSFYGVADIQVAIQEAFSTATTE